MYCVVLYSSSMAQQLNTGSWSPASVSHSCDVLRGEAVFLSSNPQTGGSGLRTYDHWRKEDPGIPLGIG